MPKVPRDSRPGGQRSVCGGWGCLFRGRVYVPPSRRYPTPLRLGDGVLWSGRDPGEAVHHRRERQLDPLQHGAQDLRQDVIASR